MDQSIQAKPAEPATVEMKDLDQFVKVLTAWHSKKVKVLEHMLGLPDGTEMVVDGDEAKPIVMTGDILVGFKAGLDLALMELGNLPFLYETEPEAATPAAAPA